MQRTHFHAYESYSRIDRMVQLAAPGIDRCDEGADLEPKLE